MKMRTNQRGHGLAPHPVVSLASILVVLAVLVLVRLEGCEASRYCSYHPEAPECRGNQQQPRPPVDANDYDDGNDDDGWDQVLQDEAQQDVVDATVSAKTDEARPPLQPAASQGWRELLHTRQLRTVFEALGAGALSLLSTASKGRYLNFSLCALARMTHDRVMDQLVLRW
jgi:hypothetical protein